MNSYVFKNISSNVIKKFSLAFYLVKPSDYTFSSVNDVPKYGIEMFPFFFVFSILELLFCQLLGKNLIVSENISCVSSAILQEVSRIFIHSAEVVVYSFVYDNLRLVTLPWDSLWTWYFCFIGVDFLFYWAHRISHEVNFFWSIHKSHHSFENFCLVNGFLLPFFQTFSNGFFYTPLALCVPPSIFFIHLQLSELYMFWLHSRLIPKLGPLEYILNTPSHHRVHHAHNPKYIDKNYGATLIIWDKLFNTFEVEEEEAVCGLTRPINSYNPFYVQTQPWIEMFSKVKQMGGIKNKLLALVMGPGWSPGKPRLGLYSDIPKITYPLTFYDPIKSYNLKAYLIFHFIVMLLFYSQLMPNIQLLTFFQKFCGVLSLILTIATISFLNENKWFGPICELLRCLAFVFFQFYLTSSPFLHDRLAQSTFLVLTLRWTFIFSGFIWFILIICQMFDVKSKQLNANLIETIQKHQNFNETKKNKIKSRLIDHN